MLNSKLTRELALARQQELLDEAARRRLQASVALEARGLRRRDLASVVRRRAPRRRAPGSFSAPHIPAHESPARPRYGR